MESVKMELVRRAVNASCPGAGGGPGECCPACDVWHHLQGQIAANHTIMKQLRGVGDDEEHTVNFEVSEFVPKGKALLVDKRSGKFTVTEISEDVGKLEVKG